MNTVVFSRYNNYVVSGSDDKVICVWSREGGDLLQSIEGHSEGVNCLAISSDNNLVYSGSED